MTVKMMVEDRCGCVAVMVVVIDDSDHCRNVHHVERKIDLFIAWPVCELKFLHLNSAGPNLIQ